MGIFGIYTQYDKKTLINAFINDNKEIVIKYFGKEYHKEKNLGFLMDDFNSYLTTIKETKDNEYFKEQIYKLFHSEVICNLESLYISLFSKFSQDIRVFEFLLNMDITNDVPKKYIKLFYEFKKQIIMIIDDKYEQEMPIGYNVTFDLNIDILNVYLNSKNININAIKDSYFKNFIFILVSINNKFSFNNDLKTNIMNQLKDQLLENKNYSFLFENDRIINYLQKIDTFSNNKNYDIIDDLRIIIPIFYDAYEIYSSIVKLNIEIKYITKIFNNSINLILPETIVSLDGINYVSYDRDLYSNIKDIFKRISNISNIKEKELYINKIYETMIQKNKLSINSFDIKNYNPSVNILVKFKDLTKEEFLNSQRIINHLENDIISIF